MLKLLLVLSAVIFMTACGGNDVDNRVAQVKGKTLINTSGMTQIEAVKSTACWKTKVIPERGDKVRLLSDYQPGTYTDLYNTTKGTITTLSPNSGPYGQLLLGIMDSAQTSSAVHLGWRGITEDTQLQVAGVTCSEHNLPVLILIYDIQDFCRDRLKLFEVNSQLAADSLLQKQLGFNPCNRNSAI